MIYKKRYLIADALFDIHYSSGFWAADDATFLYAGNDGLPGTSSVHAVFEVDSSINDELVEAHYDEVVGFKTDIGYTVSLYDSTGRITHLIQTSPDWNRIFVRSSERQKMPFFSGAGEVIFRTALLFHQGIVIHAAAIDYLEQGIVFSAPSGTGKSTHAHLWQQYAGADIINGDRPALRVHENQVELYGTPWCGSSNESMNRRVPLQAIVMLEQAPQNEIKLLSSTEAVQRLVPRCFLPFFDEHLMARALDNIGAVIERVPVYLLKCRPDKEAFELVRQCVK